MPCSQIPLVIPVSAWKPRPLPEHLLNSEEPIGLDAETFDPNLQKLGPGFVRKDGFVCGFSIATIDDQWYFPLRHNEYGSKNYPIEPTLNFLRGVLSVPGRKTALANGSYDLGWLGTEGVFAKGRIFDIQVAESLLDEDNPAGNTLEALGRRYPTIFPGVSDVRRRQLLQQLESLFPKGIPSGKDESLLDEAAYCFLDRGERVKSAMHKIPPALVAPYGMWDARRTLDVALQQAPLLSEEELDRVMDLEMRLLPVLLRMTQRGIRIDIPLAERLNRRWQLDEANLLHRVGLTIEQLSSSQQLAIILGKLGIKLPKTEKGNDSVKNAFLLSTGNKTATIIARARELHHLRSEFIEDKLLKMVTGERLHPHYVQLAKYDEDEEEDRAGTVTGRIAGRKPNEMQIPKRSSIHVDPRTFEYVEGPGGISIGKVIRATRIAEPGQRWCKFDYNSQEPRWQCHFGLKIKGAGAEEMKACFMRGEKLYNFIAKETGLVYDIAKIAYLAPTYGQGVNGFSFKTGLSIEESQAALDRTNEKFPFLKVLVNQATRLAQDRGYVRTVLGRRRHFRYFISRKYWEYKRELRELRSQEHSGNTVDKDRMGFLKRAILPVFGDKAAAKAFPEGYRRDETHKGFNAAVQGSAADQTKLAIVNQAEISLPLSPVHDEINHSTESEEQEKKLQDIQEHCISSLCPFDAAPDIAAHWQ